MLRTLVLGFTFSFAMLLMTSSMARADAEQFQMGHDIHVSENQSTGDLTCFNCSIYVRGRVKGNAFVLNGDFVVEEGGELAGDVSTLRGDIRVADGAKIAGDVAAVAGTVRKQPAGVIGGEVASLGGTGWLLLVILVPIFFLGGVIALIVWLLQRNHAPSGVPVRT